MTGPNSCGVATRSASALRQRGERDRQQGDEAEADQDPRRAAPAAPSPARPAPAARPWKRRARWSRSTAEQQREPADRRDAHPLHDAVVLPPGSPRTRRTRPRTGRVGAAARAPGPARSCPRRSAADRSAAARRRAGTAAASDAEEDLELGGRGSAGVPPKISRVSVVRVLMPLTPPPGSWRAGSAAGDRQEGLLYGVASIDPPPRASLEGARCRPAATTGPRLTIRSREGVRLVQVVRGREDRRAVLVAQPGATRSHRAARLPGVERAPSAQSRKRTRSASLSGDVEAVAPPAAGERGRSCGPGGRSGG